MRYSAIIACLPQFSLLVYASNPAITLSTAYLKFNGANSDGSGTYTAVLSDGTPALQSCDVDDDGVKTCFVTYAYSAPDRAIIELDCGDDSVMSGDDVSCTPTLVTSTEPLTATTSDPITLNCKTPDPDAPNVSCTTSINGGTSLALTLVATGDVTIYSTSINSVVAYLSCYDNYCAISYPDTSRTNYNYLAQFDCDSDSTCTGITLGGTTVTFSEYCDTADPMIGFDVACQYDDFSLPFGAGDDIQLDATDAAWLTTLNGHTSATLAGDESDSLRNVDLYCLSDDVSGTFECSVAYPPSDSESTGYAFSCDHAITVVGNTECTPYPYSDSADALDSVIFACVQSLTGNIVCTNQSPTDGALIGTSCDTSGNCVGKLYDNSIVIVIFTDDANVGQSFALQFINSWNAMSFIKGGYDLTNIRALTFTADKWIALTGEADDYTDGEVKPGATRFEYQDSGDMSNTWITGIECPPNGTKCVMYNGDSEDVYEDDNSVDCVFDGGNLVGCDYTDDKSRLIECTAGAGCTSPLVSGPFNMHCSPNAGNILCLNQQFSPPYLPVLNALVCTAGDVTRKSSCYPDFVYDPTTSTPPSWTANCTFDKSGSIVSCKTSEPKPTKFVQCFGSGSCTVLDAPQSTVPCTSLTLSGGFICAVLLPPFYQNPCTAGAAECDYARPFCINGKCRSYASAVPSGDADCSSPFATTAAFNPISGKCQANCASNADCPSSAAFCDQDDGTCKDEGYSFCNADSMCAGFNSATNPESDTNVVSANGVCLVNTAACWKEVPSSDNGGDADAMILGAKVTRDKKDTKRQTKSKLLGAKQAGCVRKYFECTCGNASPAHLDQFQKNCFRDEKDINKDVSGDFKYKNCVESNDPDCQE